jgi:predicted DNA-binding protein (MmcQ/YjbR family)
VNVRTLRSPTAAFVPSRTVASVALTLPQRPSGAEETFPFGAETSVFKVVGKMFALSQLAADSLRVSLKWEPELAEALRATHAAVVPGYHRNKRHWNTVIIDGSLPDDAIRDMIEDSYDLVVSKLPRASRRALGWRGDA